MARTMASTNLNYLYLLSLIINVTAKQFNAEVSCRILRHADVKQWFNMLR